MKVSLTFEFDRWFDKKPFIFGVVFTFLAIVVDAKWTLISSPKLFFSEKISALQTRSSDSFYLNNQQTIRKCIFIKLLLKEYKKIFNCNPINQWSRWASLFSMKTSTRTLLSFFVIKNWNWNWKSRSHIHFCRFQSVDFKAITSTIQSLKWRYLTLAYLKLDRKELISLCPLLIVNFSDETETSYN